MSDQTFDKRRLERLLRQRGPMKTADVYAEFPELSTRQVRWHLQSCPGIEFKGGKWDVIRHIAAPRYVPEWKPLRYDLHANARLREGAMDYQRMPSRYA